MLPDVHSWSGTGGEDDGFGEGEPSVAALPGEVK